MKEIGKKINKYIAIFVEKILTKLPYGLTLISIIFYYFGKMNYIDKICKFTANYLLKESRVEMLITISVVVIGFYITVMSVFGSSYSIAIVKISERKKTSDYISYAKFGIISSFLHFIFLVFCDIFISKNQLSCIVYLMLFLLMITNFIRFSSVTFDMYKYNISNANNIYKEEKDNMAKLTNILLDLSNNIYLDKLKNDKLHYEELKQMSRKQYEEGKKIKEDI